VRFEPAPPGSGAKFRCAGPGYRVWFTANELLAGSMRLRLVGSDPSAAPEGLDALPGRSHYYAGRDPGRWRTNVPGYARLHWRSVYPGIDLVYHGTRGHLEYDFVVAPGADPSVIRFAVEGCGRLGVNARGELVGGRDRRTLLRAPEIYQQRGGRREQVSGSYRVRGNTVGLEISPYDPTLTLVIDPVLVFSTYIGGSGVDAAHAVAADGEGGVYVAGYTLSPDFPVTTGAGGAGESNRDGFVARFDPSGTLVYSAYLGGSSADSAWGIAVDASGFAHVVGSTSSADFPVAGAFQNAYGGQGDAFAARLSPQGDSLMYSTYLGGASGDSAAAVAVDSYGAAYMAGTTESPDFPVAVRFQKNFGGGSDAFVTKISARGDRVEYSSYLGGSSEDGVAAIAVDARGNAYVTGFTVSSDFPVLGSFQSGLGGPGWSDAFVSKIGLAGNALVYSTYLGGGRGDSGAGIAVDSSGSAYIAGRTESPDFPVFRPLQAIFGGYSDAFVARLAASGDALVYSTFLGGSFAEYGNGIAIDATGAAFVTGEVYSVDFPAVLPLQSYGGKGDAFVTRLRPGGEALEMSTYLGGSGGDYGMSIAVDPPGRIYVAGFTYSADFPLRRPFQTLYRGQYDAFVAVLAEPPPGLESAPRATATPPAR
jgi:hypothetical protein